MGIFHLEMTIIQQLYKSHFGKEQDAWSLHMWMEELGQDYRKMWDDSQKGHVKNFRASRDIFFMVLKGYVFASVATEISGTCATFSQYTESLQNIPQSKLSDAIEKVIDYCSDFQYVDRMRDAPDEKRDVDRENMILFMQHGLVLRVFDQAVRTGDSGLMCAAISFFTVWLQDTGSANYKIGLLRLTAQLRGVWSERMRSFWMENCLVNLSGKRKAFMPLDMLNEYIVREVKDNMQPYMTEQTDDYLWNKLSLLTMFFWEVKRKFAGETDVDIFDFHSSNVDEYNDIRHVTDKVLREGLVKVCVDRPSRGGRMVSDLFVEGIGAMADGETISKVKKSLLKPVGVYDDFEDLGDADEMDGI